MELLADRSVGRSRALGLTAISLGFLMITLDATIVNVALGPIGADLGGALSTAQWIVNGYTLAFAAPRGHFFAARSEKRLGTVIHWTSLARSSPPPAWPR